MLIYLYNVYDNYIFFIICQKVIFFNYRQMKCCRNWIHATPTIWNTLVMYHTRDLMGCILKCGNRFNERLLHWWQSGIFVLKLGAFLQKTGPKIKNRWKKRKMITLCIPSTDFWEGSWKVGKTCFPLIYFTLVDDIPEPFLTIMKCYMSNKTYYVL